MKRLLLILLLIAPACFGQQSSPPALPTNLYTVAGCIPSAPCISAAAANSANLAVPGPPVFNVKNYGAKGALKSSTNGSFNNGSLTVTCSDCNFSTNAAVNDTICAAPTSNANACSYITTITNNTTVQTNAAVSNQTNTGNVYWGTFGGPSALYDDTAVGTAMTAAIAAAKLTGGGQNSVNKTAFTSAPILYFPAGHYLLCTQGLNDGLANQGFQFLGDGYGSTIISWGRGCTIGGSQAGVVQVGGSYTKFQGITFAAMFGAVAGSSFNTLGYLGGGVTQMQDVVFCCSGNNGIIAQATILFNNVTTYGHVGPGFQCNTCLGDWESGASSNNGNAANVIITNVVGSNTGLGFRIGKGVTIDECGSNSTGCTQVNNSHDVWFEGPSIFGTSGGFCVNVDANSYLHWDGGICGTFGNDLNSNGPRVAAGGTLQEADVRNIGSGSGKCITNSGTFLDNGNNTCENMYPVTSSTSTGTTAVLTVSNPSGVAPNVNCAIGDSLEVQGNNVAGYNGYFPSGITAVSATTITYLTQGSNIGAGSSGSATCRNLQSYSGNLPKALLNNPIPNTCHYTITPIANATTVTLCNFKLGSATNINFIKASSQATTTCATPPLITISDGTVSETLTLTSGKNSWDSSVDTSTGVGTTIFKPNGTITVKYDVAANSSCATPATNLSISYNIAPILSN